MNPSRPRIRSLCLAACGVLVSHCNSLTVNVFATDAGITDSGRVPTRDAGSPPVDAGADAPVVENGSAPPAISGGTILVLRDGTTAVAADPDRDVVWFVDLASATTTGQVALAAGDEPGRLVEDGAGRVHVVLRRGGGIVTVDAHSHAIVERRSVCAAPRGIAYSAANDSLLVACVSGELVSLPAAGGPATATLQLDDDLRDVVIDRGTVYVSRFRSAELLAIGSDGSVTRQRPASIAGDPMTGGLEPDVAWRTIAMPSGGVLMLHQRASTAAISTDAGGYAAGSCRGAGIVSSAMTVFDGAAAPTTGSAMGVALAMDIAIDSTGSTIAYASPMDPSMLTSRSVPVGYGPPSTFTGSDCTVGFPSTPGSIRGQPSAVAFDPSGRLIVQTREPALIQIVDRQTNVVTAVSLPGASRNDVGHRLFHQTTIASIACASCHPEGGDDGRTWLFEGLGARRTQNLRGGVLARPPFHWNGDQSDFTTLVHNVFTTRMGGGALDSAQVASLAGWIDSRPELPTAAPRDPDAAMRGRALFESPYVGCASCHSGPTFSNGQLVDVGTGGTFKVPSLLGVRWRAPYMHNGCAATLADRFGSCGGTMHGATTGMSTEQVADLVAYLETL